MVVKAVHVLPVKDEPTRGRLAQHLLGVGQYLVSTRRA
jgi:hypothetical protein